MKRKLWIFLSVVFIFSFITACSSNVNDDNGTSEKESDVEVNKEGFPIVDEELTMTMIAPGTAQSPDWGEMDVLQEYAEKTNIDFKFNTPPADDFDTNLNLAFSSGDIEDIIYGAETDDLTPAMEVDYGEQGILLPLEDLIDEYAPNIKAQLEENPEIEKSITTTDGHIYALPQISEGHRSIWKSPMWYNGDWLDELEVDELPETTDEFYELLKRFRDEDPNGNGEEDEVPLVDIDMDSIGPWFMAAFGVKDQGVVEDDGEVKYGPTTQGYKKYLEYMHKLYDEDLLDSETFSQSDEEKQAKGQNNRLGVFSDYFSYFTTGQDPEEATNNPMFKPLTSSESEEPIAPVNDGIQRGTFALSKDNPSPEASIRWLDYFYSEEGGAYLDQGPEGKLWEWNEDETKRVDLEEDTIPDGYEDSEDYRASLTPAYGIAAPYLVKDIEKEEPSVTDVFTEAETEEKMEPYGEVPFPKVYLTPEEQKEINTIEMDLESYVEQMEAKFITGVEPMSNWDDYVETIKGMNIDRYVEIYQDAYDRWEES